MTGPGAGEAGGTTAGRLKWAAIAATVALVPAMLHARAVADGLISGIDLLFLVRSAVTGDWRWLRRPWVRLAGVFWAWMILCSLPDGGEPSLQAVVLVRLLLLPAALEHWALRGPAARRALAATFAVAALWIGGQCWLQLLTGRNLFGAPRWADGALTGPYWRPKAGGTFLMVFFPAILVPALRWLADARLARRIGGVLLPVVGIATMVLIGQRMPVLLMGFGLVLAALLVRRLRLPVLAGLACGAVVVALTPLVSPATFAKLVVHFFEQMAHFRTSNYGQIYLRALSMIQYSPWTGMGVDGFRHHCMDPVFVQGSALFGVLPSQVSAAMGCNIHPHNYWLDVTVSGGLPGLAMFAALAVLWLRGIARGPAVLDDPLRIALLVGAAIVLWPLASTSSLFVADTGGWVMLTLGWGLATAADAAMEALSPGSSARAGRAPP